MTLAPVPVEPFPGLNLSPDVRQFGFTGAAECLNVDVTRTDRIAPRPGSVALASLPDYTAHTIEQIAGHAIVNWYSPSTQSVRVYNSAGTQLGSIGGVSTGAFAAMGYALSTPLLLFGDYTLPGVRYWDANAAGFGVGYVGTAPWLVAPTADFRLAGARTATNPSYVFFSDPGLPFTVGVNNYVNLDPGDGEPISNLVRWRNSVYAFKRTKIFEFFGTSTSGTGTPVFNNRRVSASIGATGTYLDSQFNRSPSAIATPEGIYFQADDGMYIMAGDAPRKISDDLDPWFQGISPATTVAPFTGNFLNCSVGYDYHYVYFRPQADGTTFAYSRKTGQWTIFSKAMYCAMPWRGSGNVQQTFYGTSGAVLNMSPAYTTDSGTAISMDYKSGLSDLGNPDTKVLRKSTVRGTGAPTLSVYTDLSPTVDAGAAGLAGLPAEAEQSFSRMGTYFQHRFTGSAFTVTSLVHYMRDQRVSGL